MLGLKFNFSYPIKIMMKNYKVLSKLCDNYRVVNFVCLFYVTSKHF